MSIGDRVFLGIVIVSFLVFGITLATVSWRTNRFMRNQAAAARREAEHQTLSKAA